jgi:hypothetical protein
MTSFKNHIPVIGLASFLLLPMSGYAQWTVDGAAPDYEIENTGAAIPFTIEGGAPADIFYISSEGNLGLGAAPPTGAFSPRLYISDPTPDIELDDLDQNQTWQLFANGGDGSSDLGGMGFVDITANTLPLYIESGAPNASLLVKASGNIGMGTAVPTEKLHVKDGNLRVEQTATNRTAKIEFATELSSWEIKQNGQTGRLTYFSPSGGASGASFKFDTQAKENLFRIGVRAADTVDINGKLVINGTQVTPDYVFDPDYPLESIEEHAELMWKNKHLPALPGASKNEEGVDIVQHQYGTLEELEKAHIYISQLNEELKELKSEQEKRIIQLEMALAEVMRNQSSEVKVGSAN